MLHLTSAFLFAVGLALAAGPQFEARDTAGVIHRPQEWATKKAVIIFFVMTDCPLANGYVPEMNRIRADYESRGVAVYAVQSDNTVPETEVRRYAKEYAYSFPLLLDPKFKLAHLTGANVVPEAAVLSPSGQVLYLGRIDNKVEDITKPRLAATEPELRNAIDAILAGKTPKVARTRAVGCSINLEKP